MSLLSEDHVANSSHLGNASSDDEELSSSQKSCEYVDLMRDKDYAKRGFKRQNVVTLKYFLDKRPSMASKRDRTGGYEKCLPYSLVIYTVLLFVAAMVVHF